MTQQRCCLNFDNIYCGCCCCCCCCCSCCTCSKRAGRWRGASMTGDTTWFAPDDEPVIYGWTPDAIHASDIFRMDQARLTAIQQQMAPLRETSARLITQLEDVTGRLHVLSAAYGALISKMAERANDARHWYGYNGPVTPEQAGTAAQVESDTADGSSDEDSYRRGRRRWWADILSALKRARNEREERELAELRERWRWGVPHSGAFVPSRGSESLETRCARTCQSTVYCPWDSIPLRKCGAPCRYWNHHSDICDCKVELNHVVSATEWHSHCELEPQRAAGEVSGAGPREDHACQWATHPDRSATSTRIQATFPPGPPLTIPTEPPPTTQSPEDSDHHWREWRVKTPAVQRQDALPYNLWSEAALRRDAGPMAPDCHLVWVKWGGSWHLESHHGVR